MKRIAYSPDYKEKLETIREWLNLRFGKKTCAEHMSKIRQRLTSLKEFPNLGISVRAMFGVDSDYEFIFVSHNYIFYYQDEEFIYIVNIYDDREDFMYKLFGIRNFSDETGQDWRD